MRESIKVGEILVQAGVIDSMQLKAALGEQTRWGRRLGVTLIKLGFVEERDLVRALASQLSMPVASLEGKRIHPEILALVPAEIAETHAVIPLFKKDEHGVDTLFIGMEDPSDLGVLDDLAFRTGLQIKPVMVGPSELAEAIDRAYRRPDLAAAPIESVATQAASAPAESKKVEITDGTAELAAFWALPETQAEPEPVAPRSANGVAPVAPELPPASHAPTPATPAAPATSSEVVAPIEASVSMDGMPCVEIDPTPAPGAPSDYEVKTRAIVRALTQLLIESGVVNRDDFHTRVRDLQLAASDED